MLQYNKIFIRKVHLKTTKVDQSAVQNRIKNTDIRWIKQDYQI